GNRPAGAAELSARGIATGASGRPPHRSGNQIVVEGFKNSFGVSGLAGGGRQGERKCAHHRGRTPCSDRRRLIAPAVTSNTVILTPDLSGRRISAVRFLGDKLRG